MSTGDPLRAVSIVGIGQIPIKKVYDQPLKSIAAQAVRLAMEDAGIDRVDACGLKANEHVGVTGEGRFLHILELQYLSTTYGSHDNSFHRFLLGAKQGRIYLIKHTQWWQRLPLSFL